MYHGSPGHTAGAHFLCREGLAGWLLKSIYFRNSTVGECYFLVPNKKVTKEVGIGEALRKGALPYVPHQPQRLPVSKNVPIFEHLRFKNFQVFSWQTAENRYIFGCRLARRRRGFLRGHAFSECPLKSRSFGTFLGETRKVHYSLLLFAQRYRLREGQ